MCLYSATVPAAADDLPDPLARHQAQQRAGRPNGATDGAQGNRATEQEGREATGSGSEERGEEGETVSDMCKLLLADFCG